MAKTQESVDELVSKVARGEIKLPEMQRGYVWKATRVRDLLDSLYRKYPSGSILLWETDEEVPQQKFAVSQEAYSYSGAKLLLDGQQRLTSLSAVIRGEPVVVRNRKRPIEILFNLDHPDELSVVTDINESTDEDDEDLQESQDSTEDELQLRFNRMAFVVGTKRLEAQPLWVRVSDVFKSADNTPFLKKAGVTTFDDPRYSRFNDRLQRLRDIRKYEYRVDVLERSLSYNEVTEIFVRVNSLGAKLRSSDLALAQITAKWRGSLAEFQEYQQSCKGLGFDFDQSVHLKNLVAIATGQSRFKAVNNLKTDSLKSSWEDCKKGMDYALNFLRQNAGIDSPALLSSPFIAVALSYFGHVRGFKVAPQESDELRRWVLIANAKGRYSRGSTETLLDQDLSELKRGGGPATLMTRLKTQVGRLDVHPAELEGKNQRSGMFKTMFLAFKDDGARDWASDLTISVNHTGKAHRLQFHHIFPKAVLKGHASTKESDDVANLAFIGGSTNRKISDKEPSQYIPELRSKIGEKPFSAQCIPLDHNLLDVESYKEFIAKRRQLICDRINMFFGLQS